MSDCQFPRRYTEWKDKSHDEAMRLVKEHMPSGSGWDMGTTFDIVGSGGNRLFFTGSYHHYALLSDSGRFAVWRTI